MAPKTDTDQECTFKPLPKPLTEEAIKNKCKKLGKVLKIKCADGKPCNKKSYCLRKADNSISCVPGSDPHKNSKTECTFPPSFDPPSDEALKEFCSELVVKTDNDSATSLSFNSLLFLLILQI